LVYIGGMDYKEALDIISFPTLKRELLLAFRGKRTQIKVAKALGVSSQQIYRWEAGTRGISWRQFLNFARTCGVSTNKFFESLGYSGSPDDVPGFVTFCLQNVPTSAAKRILGCSQFTLSRWRNGKGEPSAEDVLRLVHFFLNALAESLAGIVDMKLLPSVIGLYQTAEREREFHFRNPVAAAITIALNIEPYLSSSAHNLNELSKLVGIGPEEIEALLGEMAELGIIDREEKGKFRVRPRSLVTKGNLWGAMNLREYWARRAAEKFASARQMGRAPPCSLAGYNVFALNARSYEEIKKVYLQVYSELVRTAIHRPPSEEASEGEFKIFALNLQVIALESDEKEFA